MSRMETVGDLRSFHYGAPGCIATNAMYWLHARWYHAWVQSRLREHMLVPSSVAAVDSARQSELAIAKYQ
jgi:hypothetical protein